MALLRSPYLFAVKSASTKPLGRSPISRRRARQPAVILRDFDSLPVFQLFEGVALHRQSRRLVTAVFIPHRFVFVPGDCIGDIIRNEGTRVSESTDDAMTETM